MDLALATLLLAQTGDGTAAVQAACGTPEESSSVCRAVLKATDNEFLATMAETVVVKPAKVVLIVGLAWVATRLIGRAVARFVAGVKGDRAGRRLGALREHAPAALVPAGEAPESRAAKRAETIGDLIRSIAGFAVWSVAVLMVLAELGLNLGPLIAGAGIVGVALGFGAQNLVRDFISGIFMLAEDQYGVGDVIDVGPATGVVEAVSLRTTRLRDVNGVVWHVPNGMIERIGNKSQQWSRALLDVDVAYDTDVDFAGEVIKRTIVAEWQDEQWKDTILEEPQVWGVENLGADGMTIRVVVKTLPSKQFEVARHLRARIKAAFDEVGIEIPFPQRTIWHRNAGGFPGADGLEGDGPGRKRVGGRNGDGDADQPEQGERGDSEPAMSSSGRRAD
jgi:small-conductance mechanosensitive channel